MRHLWPTSMSFKLVKTVIRSRQHSAAHKLVLIVIADHTNENKSGTAWPSIETIADYVGLKRRQVQRILRDLESSGQVKVWKKNAQMGTNRYQIVVDNVSPMTPQRVTHDTPNVSYKTQWGVTHDTRVHKEQITKRVGGAPGPQPEGAPASQQNETENVATVGQANAADTPQCQEHKQLDHQCENCYAHEVSKWTQKGTP